MRRLRLHLQTTLDGYLAGPHSEMGWMTFPWTEDLETYVETLTDEVDCIVLGRKLAEGFIPHWLTEPDGEDRASIDKMNETRKVVISNSLTYSPWENTVVAGGDLTATIGRLKANAGGDMIAYGGAALAADLIGRGLLDELHLFVNPTAIGAGKPVFPNLESYTRLRLIEAHPFDCGITALHLAPMGN